jgi:hypothetical protein
MSEDELYELARQRVERRNRRWMLWGIDLLLWLVYIGVIAGFRDAIPRELSITVAVAWMGVLTLHGIVIGMSQSRDQDITAEVERLREAVYNEKPKRLELDEDGELVDVIEDKAKRSRMSE